MGWQTDLLTTIVFNRETFNNKYDVQNKIDECDESIKFYETTLFGYISANPKDMVSKDWKDEPMSYLYRTYKDIIEDYTNCIIKKYKLELLLDSWDECHNDEGLAKTYEFTINGGVPRCNMPYNFAMISGDFVKDDGIYKWGYYHSKYGEELQNIEEINNNKAKDQTGDE